MVNFDDTSDLVTLFNASTNPVFTNIGYSGINNSGSINVPLGSNEIWTTKQGYSVSGAGDKYTFSAYFKIKANSGYGGLGFSDSATNTRDSFGSPLKGVGVMFHGGGGAFVNNRVNTNVSWIAEKGDLILGNWYKMIFEVTAKGSNTYDLSLQIWNSDAGGVLGTLFTQQSLNDVVNADIGSASTLHGYFSAAGSRMEKIDNFLIILEGNTSFVETGLPVVLTDNVTDISNNSAFSGGNVTNEQGSSVTSKGVCWSETSSPTIISSCSNDGSGTGAFISTISNLNPGTLYYLRSYATNVLGTSYGSEKTFTTTGGQSASSPSGLSSPSTPFCGDALPATTPDLFQINLTKNTAKLFFTPISNTSDFYISFSENPNAEKYGEQVSLKREGVQSHTVFFLRPFTTYYFKVRGQIGCMPGEWSKIMKVKTNNSISYRYFSSIKP